MKTLTETGIPMPTPQKAAETKLPSHLNGVDGLRGLAALIVVVYHFFNQIGEPEFRPWHHINFLRPMHDGWCGVNLFLVLSGFCLYWPYARDTARQLRFLDFMKRRVRRIVPAYYASLIIVPALYEVLIRILKFHWMGVPRPHGITDVILHLLLLHSLTTKTFASWNGVTWSLGLEWTWYLAFPLAVWLYRRCGAGTALLTLAAVTLIYRIGLYLYLGPAAHYSASQTDFTWMVRNFLAARLFEFGVGMYVAWLLANKPITRRLTFISFISIPILFMLAHVATPIDVFLPVRDPLYGIAFALMLLLTVSPVQNIAKSVLSGAFFSGVGEYSYSLYLFHMPFVSCICGYLLRYHHKGPATFLVTLLFIPLVLLVTKLAYRLFEKPFMTTKKKQAVVIHLASSPQQQTATALGLPSDSKTGVH